MPRTKPISEADLAEIIKRSEDLHAGLTDLLRRAELSIKMDGATLERAMMLLRLSRVASDLAYRMIGSERQDAEKRVLEASLRAQLRG